MPIWSTDPPQLKDHHAFRILRTPAAQPLTAIATSAEVIGCPTHFINHRTMPCEGGEHCKACAEGHSWRWHGYIAAILLPTHEHFIFEFTAPAAETFRTYQIAHGSIRACRFQANRPSKRPNGRVVIACKYTDPTELRLPDPPDVKRILTHIWGIKNTAATTDTCDRPPFRRLRLKHPDDTTRKNPNTPPTTHQQPN